MLKALENRQYPLTSLVSFKLCLGGVKLVFGHSARGLNTVFQGFTIIVFQAESICFGVRNIGIKKWGGGEQYVGQIIYNYWSNIINVSMSCFKIANIPWQILSVLNIYCISHCTSTFVLTHQICAQVNEHY